MPIRKPITAISIGTVLLFFGVASAERYLFKPPVNLGPPVNTEWFEADPYITADGQKLFFVSDRPGGFGNTDIWMSNWNGTNWSNPVNLGANVNGGLREWSPSVSPDGKKLYFLAFGLPGGEGSWDVWMSEFDSVQQQWGPAQNLGPVINTFGVEWSPNISYNGQSLYYASNGFGHGCGQALYVARWNGGSWDEPEPLPLVIHETCTEEQPSLTVDEKSMYFVRWDNFQSIYVTEKDSMGTWGQPVQLDTTVNPPSWGTAGLAVTPDGQRLYFSSNRPGGISPEWWDIWVTERAIPGDLNLDGEISASDVVLELNKVFLGQLISAPDGAADLNCDNILTAPDVVLLLNRAFLGKQFPC